MLLLNPQLDFLFFSILFYVFISFTRILSFSKQEEKVEIVASKFGDRVSHACLAAVDHEEYNIGLPAKQGIARNESLTVVNNFQFLNEDLAENEIQEAAKVTSLCKLNTKPLEYHLEKGDDVSVKLTPYQVAVKLLTNCYGMTNNLHMN